MSGVQRGVGGEILKEGATIIINITPHATGFIAYMRYLNIGFHKLYCMVYIALMKCRQRHLIKNRRKPVLFIYLFFPEYKIIQL